MDALNYIFVTNPLSKGVWSGLDQVAKSVGLKPKVTQVKSMATQMSSVSPLWKLAGKNLYIVRLAGISGAGAVVLGAYGAHRDWETQNGLKEAEQARKTFDTANRYHFLHTIALLSIPIVRRPALTASLFLAGMSLFCGTLYYRSLTGNQRFKHLAPIGGSCLILGWLSIMF
ncbi:transmembrane protein 256-like isoform X2 [Phlebotomus papatasi]|uniref:transmembrane protein 256-like isoform X2 n=1 Tax=Phlebotomus papatasi TaxID=29031 RepID=UPI00248419DB|nr:transmembrane protein 256-like isoform X2 [Phlebotomus papatasi]